jgi:hypothetical protein
VHAADRKQAAKARKILAEADGEPYLPMGA